jgi:hypothetical protein
MTDVIVAVVAFIAGGVVVWIYKAKAQAAIQKELDALKSSAIKGINKL